MSLWLKCYLCASHEVTETFSRSRKYSIYIMWNWKSSCWNSWWYQKCINCVIVSSLQLSSLHPLLLSNTTFYSSALSSLRSKYSFHITSHCGLFSQRSVSLFFNLPSSSSSSLIFPSSSFSLLWLLVSCGKCISSHSVFRHTVTSTELFVLNEYYLWHLVLQLHFSQCKICHSYLLIIKSRLFPLRI